MIQKIEALECLDGTYRKEFSVTYRTKRPGSYVSSIPDMVSPTDVLKEVRVIGMSESDVTSVQHYVGKVVGHTKEVVSVRLTKEIIIDDEKGDIYELDWLNDRITPLTREALGYTPDTVEV